MADNVNVTEGSGKTVATDDNDGLQYQKIKLMGGDPNSASPIMGDSTYGMDVDVTRMPELASGTNVIGGVRLYARLGNDSTFVPLEAYDVDGFYGIYVNTGVVQAQLVVSSAHVGQVDTCLNTDYVYYGGNAISPANAIISASVAGDIIVVSATPNQKIRILSGNISFSNVVDVYFKSNLSTSISGKFYGVAGTSIVLPTNQYGYFETATSGSLLIYLSGSVSIGGNITYIKI